MKGVLWNEKQSSVLPASWEYLPNFKGEVYMSE